MFSVKNPRLLLFFFTEIQEGLRLLCTLFRIKLMSSDLFSVIDWLVGPEMAPQWLATGRKGALSVFLWNFLPRAPVHFYR